MPAFEAAYGNEDATEGMIAAAVNDLEQSGSLEYGWKGARVPRGRPPGPGQDRRVRQPPGPEDHHGLPDGEDTVGSV